jgi:hypothetical protein
MIVLSLIKRPGTVLDLANASTPVLGMIGEDVCCYCNNVCCYCNTRAFHNIPLGLVPLVGTTLIRLLTFPFRSP